MAKRYYICPVVQMDDGTGMLSYMPSVAALPGVSYSAVMPTGPDGRPAKDWCLVIVASSDHTAIRALAGVDPLPDFPLDGKVSAIQRQTMVAMKGAAEKRGVDPSLIDGADGYRDALRIIGRALEPAFDENKLDVADR